METIPGNFSGLVIYRNGFKILAAGTEKLMEANP